MGYLNISVKLNINKGRKNIVQDNISDSFSYNQLLKGFGKLLTISYMSISLLMGACYPLASQLPFSFVKAVEASDSEFDPSAVIDEEITLRMAERKNEVVEIARKDALKEKYQSLAGRYYYANVEEYLPIIDKVLKEKGLDDDAFIVQAMFFIGQYESHWNTGSISASSVGSEHPTGIFQFLPSTFRSVSSGDIFDAEDQIRAFITMVERGRIDEYGTLYLPWLDPYVKSYVLSYRGE